MNDTAHGERPHIPAPSAPRRTHLLAAGILWSAAGAGLAVTGARWILASPSSYAVPVLLATVAAGLLKAHFVLDGAARRIVERIEARGDGRCLGGFLSWRSWAVVIFMMIAGRALRASPLPLLARGGLYAAVGVALLGASRRLWAQWWRRVRASA